LAAIATAITFAISSVINTFTSRKLGSWIVNRMRLLFAVLFLIIIHLIMHLPLPFFTSAYRSFWLGLSGIIGLALGDALLFQAFILIGARLSMLLMSLAPVVSAMLAWIFLGETLSTIPIFGIILAVGGVGIVLLDKNNKGSTFIIEPHHYRIGILFGLSAAICQALGMIIARPGLEGGFPAISGSLLRMFFAAIVIWIITIFQHQVRITFSKLTGQLLLFISIGAFIGPVVGVTLSLYAIQNTAIGIASTLIALTPVFLLPIGYFIFHERFGIKAILGTILAIVGVALLFLG
jgi:drug/metabolite transporter (DMT)-like permease